MHIHYLTLRQLASKLEQLLLPSGVLVESFTQEKDELILGLANPENEIFLKVKCGGPVPYIWPQKDFARAKKNTLPLFQEVVGPVLKRIYALNWDRVLVFEFEGGRELILKMHGLNSNVLLREAGKVTTLFRNSIVGDLNFSQEERPDFSLPPGDFVPEDVGKALKALAPSLDRNFAERVEKDLREGKTFREALISILQEAEKPPFYLRRNRNKAQFLLFDPKEEGAVRMEGGLLKGIDTFLRNWHLLYHYRRLHQETSKRLAEPIKKLSGQIKSYERSVRKIGEARSAEEIGSIIMANLHALKQGMEKAELFDFYTNEQISIKLDPRLSPQKSAEKFYQKQKKRKEQAKHMQVQLVRLEEELLPLWEANEEFEVLPAPDDLKLGASGADYGPMKAIRQFRKDHEELMVSGKAKQEASQKAFLEFELEGYRIYVGRNAKNNDELTLHFARKTDLWLHAKDVTGSHVIIRHRPGRDLPRKVLEYAAGLAAKYSRRKTDSLVPVQYTPRKYVRKRKGDPAGAVMVDREEVILIEPLE